MEQDDLDNFRDYDLRIRILEASKLTAKAEEDLDTLMEIEERIKILTEEQSNLALKMFEEGQL